MLVAFVCTMIFRKKWKETIREKKKQDDQLCTILAVYVLQNTTKPNKFILQITNWKVIEHVSYHHTIILQHTTMRRIDKKILLFYSFVSIPYIIRVLEYYVCTLAMWPDIRYVHWTEIGLHLFPWKPFQRSHFTWIRSRSDYRYQEFHYKLAFFLVGKDFRQFNSLFLFMVLTWRHPR